jgi:predicted GIY-YIG superfamily endonuclease
MAGYDPLQLRDEVLEEYGIEVSLDECIDCLKVDPNMTPEAMAMMIQDRMAEENEPLREGKLVKIPNGFKAVDFDRLNAPESPGNYIWLLKDGCNLPQPKSMPNPVFNRVKVGNKELRVFYTGIGEKNLRKRISEHLKGKIATSTLRKSIAALMGFPFEQFTSGQKKKCRMSKGDEEMVSNWLRKNCVLIYKENTNYRSMEEELIKKLDPPLNIEHNPQCNNGIYVSQLSQLRKNPGSAGKGTAKKPIKAIWICFVIIILVLSLVLAILSSPEDV